MESIFDIILHGKPNAQCYKSTGSIDADFCKNIAEKFFQSMSTIKEREALIVDIRKWRGKMYTIYTFWRGGNVSDIADRKSYLAVSIVVTGYFQVVSTVYELLERVCRERIVGHYVSEEWKYQVPDFNDNTVFKTFVASIMESFENIHGYFDADSSIPSEITQDCYSSILDCDSRAFREELKQCGRIYVSRTCRSKNENLKYMQQKLQGLQTLADANKSKSEKLQSYVQKNDALETELRTLQKRESELEEELKNIKNKEKRTNRQYEGDKVHAETNRRVDVIPTAIKNKRVQPLINTLLLIVLVCMRLCDTGQEGMYKAALDSLNAKIDNMAAGVEDLRKLYMNLHGTNEEADDNGGVSAAVTNNNITMDEDCNLIIMQNYMVVNASSIDRSNELLILPTHHADDTLYSFYASNLADSEKKKLENKQRFKLIKNEQDKAITIFYRTRDRKNTNKNNILTF